MKLHLNATLRAALIAAITAVGMAMPQTFAEDTPLTITPTSWTGKHTNISWTEQTGDLTSWKLTFDLTVSNGNANDFFNISSNNGTAQAGWALGTTGTTLQLANGGRGNTAVITLTDAFTLNTPQAVTFQFVRDVDSEGVSLGTGTFSVTAKGVTKDYKVNSLTDTALVSGSRGHIWANGNPGQHQLANITLTQLEDHEVIIPTFTWKGESTNNDWSANVWNEGAAFESGGKAVFGAEGYEVVAITTAVNASGISVSEKGYTFEIGTAGSLAAAKANIEDGASLTIKGAGAATVTSLSGAGNFIIGASGNVTLGAASSYTGKVIVDGGTLNLGNASYTLGGLEISNGGVATTTRHDGTGCVTGDINILEGGTFRVIGGHDAFGYNGNQTDNIYMKGAADKIATLSLEQNTTNSVTMQTNLHMAGYSAIVSKEGTAGFNTHGCSITVEGVQNTIQLMNLRRDVTIDVAAAGTLEIAKVTKNSDGTKIITKTGEGTLTFKGDSLMNGLNVNKGTVQFTAGTSTLDALNVASDGKLEISGLGTDVTVGGTANTLSSTIHVNAATLHLNGTYAIDGNIGDMTISYSGGQDSHNGFRTSSGEIVVYKAEADGTVEIGEGAQITRGGVDVKDQLEDGVYTASEETDYTNFYVNTGTEKVSKAYSEHTPTAFTLAENTKLDVDKNVTATVAGSGVTSVVDIATGRELVGTAQNVKIAGSGTYALTGGSASLGTNVSLDDSWSGTVRLGGFGFSNTDLAPFMNSSKTSWVEMYGITGGYLKEWNGGTEAANIRLTNPGDDGIAWKWSDGTSGTAEPTIEFTGEWDGSGTFQLSNLRQNITFSGDISKWDGTFDYHGNHGTTLTFKGDASEINAAILNNGVNNATNTQKQFHLVVQNEATFGQDVAAYTLAVAEGASASFQGDATFHSMSGTGAVALGGDSTLAVADAVGSNVQISAADGATIDASLAPAQVSIAGTAHFVQGIDDANGVRLSTEEGTVDVKNNGAYPSTYTTGNGNMDVQADAVTLQSTATDAVSVDNALTVEKIINESEHELAVTNLVVNTLSTVSALSGNIDITSTQGDVVVAEINIAEGKQVFVHNGPEQTEVTVTITDTLVGGSATLLANLTLVGDSTLDVRGGGDNALTLGSTLTVDTTTGFINLDNDTLIALDALQVGQRLALVKAKDGTTLAYGGEYADTWFDGMFNREGSQYTLAGDFQVFADSDAFGLVKFSNTPEPTTGTLSLLALAALAARRRKH